MKNNRFKIYCLLLSLILLVGCGSKTASTPDNNDIIDEILSEKDNLLGVHEGLIEKNFLEWISSEFGKETLEKINSAIKDDSFTAEICPLPPSSRIRSGRVENPSSSPFSYSVNLRSKTSANER